MTKQLFIVGPPRSGTKLLRDLLNRNERISVPNEETQLLPELIWKYETERAKPKPNVQEIESLVQNSNFLYLMECQNRKIDFSCDSSLFEKGVEGIFKAMLAPYVLEDINNDEAIIWGDKTPFYSMHIDKIARHFSNPYFVQIVRDPRDVALSGKKAWGKSFVRTALDWKKSVEGYESYAKSNTPRCISVRYEDLLSNPEQVLTSICEFLGINFVQEMLTLEKSHETWGSGKGQTSILASNSNKFTSHKNVKEVKRLEELLFDQMGQYKYQPVNAKHYKPVSFVEKYFYSVLDAVRVLNVYIKEKGLYAGVKYKFKQRFLRR